LDTDPSADKKDKHGFLKGKIRVTPPKNPRNPCTESQQLPKHRIFYEVFLTKLSIHFNVKFFELGYDGSKRKEVAIETPPEKFEKGRDETP
jgi:hypothetical protein